MTGLSSLTYLGAGGSGPYPGAHITYNPKLTNLDGLNNLTAIAGMLEISNNATLTNLDGLSSLQSIGNPPPSYQNLIITNNPALVSLKGLRSITSLPGPLDIENNAALPNLDGLDSLRKIDGYGGSLIVTGNTSLKNIDGLSSLSYVFGNYGSVSIINNPSLTNINGLSSLEKIVAGGPRASLNIKNNAILADLNGLSSLIEIGGASHYLTVTDNSQLARCCGLFNILKSPSMNCSYGCAYITISGNGNGCAKEEILASGPCPVVCNGDITLTSQADINAFPSTHPCNEISGTLTISGNDITNLDSLHFVTKVDMDLYISNNPNLNNLTGLSSLTYVGASLQIQRGAHITNNQNLTNLDGLNKLASIGGMLEISNNAKLTNLDGLAALTSIAVAPTDQCLWIMNNPSLISLNGLHSVTSLPGHVDIENNSSLPNLSGLDSVTAIGNSYTGDLILNGNASLANLNSLSNVTSLRGGLRITNNTALTNLDGLSSLKSIGYNNQTNLGLNISGNPALISLKGLRWITSVNRRVYIVNNTALPNLDGFESLVSINGNPGGLTVSGNTSLTNINGLSLLSFVSDGIVISDNPALTNLNGLSSLTQIVGGISAGILISNNSSLANVDSLSSLTDIEGAKNVLTVTGNPQLAKCCGLYNLLKSPSMNCSYGCSQITISGNGAGCTKDDILTAGPCCTSPSGCTPPEPAQPTNMIFSSVTDTTMTVSFTAPSGNPSGYITLMQAFGAPYPDDAPVDGTTYHPGDVIGSSTIVINVGNETSLDVIYLSPGVDYYFDVFSYNISNGVYDYLTANPLERDQWTSSSGSPSARVSANYTAKSTAFNSGEISTSGPFPNPFSESITFPFTTSKQNAFVHIVIYDLTGRKITDVVSQNFAPGYHEARWLGIDNFGSKVSQGIYIYRIRTDESKNETRGLVVAK